MDTLPDRAGLCKHPAFFCLSISLLLCCAAAAPANAQSAAPSDVHHRHRSRRTRHAVPDSTTLLQVETGYDGDFDAPGLRRDQTSTLTTVVTPTPRFLVQIDFDFWTSQLGAGPSPRHGRGDTHVSLQSNLRIAGPGQLSFGLAYDIKLPTARPGDLGSGRVDHRLLSLLSLSAHRMEADFSFGLDANGRPGGLAYGVDAALSLTYFIVPRGTAHLGVSGGTVDTDEPAGWYLSGGTTWQLTPVFGIDVGGRLGLSAQAPAAGLTAGLTAAIGHP